MLFQGEFKDNKKFGIGIDFSEEGIIAYKGEYKFDKRNGIGSVLYPKNTFYLGEWKNGLQDGFVIII